MEKKDILHLARLSRIKISDEESEALLSDIDAVVQYVSAIDDITADGNSTKKVGAVYNVFREDAVTVKEGEYTEILLDEAPHRKDKYISVKKILNND